MHLIEFRNVTKVYRNHFWTPQKTVVDQLSFSVNPHQIVGFIGPNGAGKTTSLKMLLGLVRPTSGEIRINGRDATDNPRVRTGVAYLSEQPYFYEHLTVAESLVFAYRLLGLPHAGERSEIDRVLETVELTSARSNRVKELSKGMQQRLNMAQALLGRAQTCIFDEPMSGLDPLGRTLFRRIFRQLVADGTSIFFSTHIIDDIETLCDSIVVLSKGKLAYEGPIATILEKGFLGTDITIPAIDKEFAQELFAAGCEVTTPQPDVAVVFVPKAGDPLAVQKILAARGIFPNAVTRRNRSLENMLYEVRSGE